MEEDGGERRLSKSTKPRAKLDSKEAKKSGQEGDVRGCERGSGSHVAVSPGRCWLALQPSGAKESSFAK